MLRAGLGPRLGQIQITTALCSGQTSNLVQRSGLTSNSRPGQQKHSRHSGHWWKSGVSHKQSACQSRAISHSPRLHCVASMETLQFQDIVTVEPKGAHSATIIFLHGLGSSGQNISMVSQGLNLPHVKYVFPTAPNQPMTCFGGAPTNGWFDLYGIERMMIGEKDEEGIKLSIDYVAGLVQKEIDAGIPATRIIVGGFSQGGHIAAKYTLQNQQNIKACVMLSTWLEKIPDKPSAAGLAATYWISHGTKDALLNVQMSTISEGVLRGKGCNDVRKKVYAGLDHSVSPEVLVDLQKFLDGIIAAEKVPAPTLEAVDKMSVKQLRDYLQSNYISTTGFLEKQEFLDAVKNQIKANAV